MIVAVGSGKLLGFLQILGPSPDLIIDLIGVLPENRSRGIGAAMIDYAEQNLRSSNRVFVGTQAANIRSLTFYSKMGFQLESAAYVFHLHGRSGRSSFASSAHKSY